MNVLRRNARHGRRAGILAWALMAVVMLGSKQSAAQSTQQQTPPADSASAPAQAGETPPRLTAEEIRRYDEAKTLIDWTPEQIQSRSELQALEPAESQQGLPEILRAVGERVSRLFEDFPDLSSTENVRSAWCGSSLTGKCHVNFKGKFNYLVVRGTEGDIMMVEYRTDLKGRPVAYLSLGRGRALLTYGFTTTPLQHFHPQNQAACRFRYFGRQTAGGRAADVVGFAEIPGKYPWPAVLRHGNEVSPLCLQGLAWIDASTYRVVRIQSDLVAPPPDGDLERETTRVEFSEIPLHQASVLLWLPTQVVVDVVVHHQRFQNVHTYSGFKLFTVETHTLPVTVQ